MGKDAAPAAKEKEKGKEKDLWVCPSEVKEACKQAQRDSQGTTLVLADLRILDVDAVKIIAYLRKHLPGMKVLHLTRCEIATLFLRDISDLTTLERISLELCGCLSPLGEGSKESETNETASGEKNGKRRTSSAGSANESNPSDSTKNGDGSNNKNKNDGSEHMWDEFCEHIAAVPGRPLDVRSHSVREAFVAWSRKLPYLVDVTVTGSKLASIPLSLLQMRQLQRLAVTRGRVHGTEDWLPKLQDNVSSSSNVSGKVSIAGRGKSSSRSRSSLNSLLLSPLPGESADEASSKQLDTVDEEQKQGKQGKPLKHNEGVVEDKGDFDDKDDTMTSDIDDKGMEDESDKVHSETDKEEGKGGKGRGSDSEDEDDRNFLDSGGEAGSRDDNDAISIVSDDDSGAEGVLIEKDTSKQKTPIKKTSAGALKPVTLQALGCERSLRELDLSFNFVKFAPEHFRRFRSIRVLDLSHNCLKHLPVNAICKLKALKSLDLSFNFITGELPKYIGRLESLAALNLRGNKLQALPSEIGNLKKLRTLTVAENELTTLPSAIRFLAQLQTLVVSRNKITELPSDIFGDDTSACFKLSKLNLDDNDLEHLPPSVSKLQNMTDLSFKKNRVSDFSTDFSKLTNLRSLVFDNNSICVLPLSLVRCSKLATLSLGHNIISDPASILALSSIRTLNRVNVAGNPLPGGSLDFVEEHGAMAWMRQSQATQRHLESGRSAQTLEDVHVRPGRSPSIGSPERKAKGKKREGEQPRKRTLRSIFSSRRHAPSSTAPAASLNPRALRPSNSSLQHNESFVIPDMPTELSDAELTTKLVAALDDMEMPDKQKQSILMLPSQAKWKLLCQYQVKTDADATPSADSEHTSPDHFSSLLREAALHGDQRLQQVLESFAGKHPSRGHKRSASIISHPPGDAGVALKELSSLRLTLEAANRKWISEFVGERRGLHYLVRYLSLLCVRPFKDHPLLAGTESKASSKILEQYRVSDDCLYEGLRLLRGLARIRMPLLISLADVPVPPTTLLACALYDPLFRVRHEALELLTRFADISSVSAARLISKALQFAADLNGCGAAASRFLVLADILLLGSPQNVALSRDKMSRPDAEELAAIGISVREPESLEEQLHVNDLKLAVLSFANIFLDGIDDLEERFETRGELLSIGFWQRTRELLGDESAAADGDGQCHFPLTPLDSSLLPEFMVEAQTFKQSMNDDLEDMGGADDVTTGRSELSVSSSSVTTAFGYAYAPRLAASLSSSGLTKQSSSATLKTSTRIRTALSDSAAADSIILLNHTYLNSSADAQRTRMLYDRSRVARTLFEVGMHEFGISADGVSPEEMFGLFISRSAVAEAKAAQHADDEMEAEAAIDCFSGWVDLDMTLESLNLPTDTNVELKAKAWTAVITLEVPSSLLRSPDAPRTATAMFSPDMAGDTAATTAADSFRKILNDGIDLDAFGLVLRHLGPLDDAYEREVWLTENDLLHELNAHTLTRSAQPTAEFVLMLKPYSLRFSFMGFSQIASDISPMHSASEVLSAVVKSGLVNLSLERVQEYVLSMDAVDHAMSTRDIYAIGDGNVRTFLRDDEPLVLSGIADQATLFVSLRPRQFELHLAAKLSDNDESVPDPSDAEIYTLFADANVHVSEVLDAIISHMDVAESFPHFVEAMKSSAQSRRVVLCTRSTDEILDPNTNVRDIVGDVLLVKVIRVLTDSGGFAVRTTWTKRSASGSVVRDVKVGTRGSFLAEDSSYLNSSSDDIPSTSTATKLNEEDDVALQDEDMLFVPVGEKDAGQLEGASLNQLVVYITESPLKDDEARLQVAHALCEAYWVFSSSLELLVRLLDRFAVPSDFADSDPETSRAIQSRVCVVIEMWQQAAQRRRLYPVWCGPDTASDSTFRQYWEQSPQDIEEVSVLDTVSRLKFDRDSNGLATLNTTSVRKALLPLLESLDVDLGRSGSKSLQSELRTVFVRTTGHEPPFVHDELSDTAKKQCPPVEPRIPRIMYRPTSKRGLFKTNQGKSVAIPGTDEIDSASTPASSSHSTNEARHSITAQPSVFRNLFGGGHTQPTTDPASADLLTFFDLYGREVAVAYTLRAHKHYKAIRFVEFGKQAWSKKKIEHLSPHIVLLTRMFDKLAYQVATTIVSEARYHKRAQLIASFIRMAGFFGKFRNYLCLTAVISGLYNSAVQRLKWSFKKVPGRATKELEELETLMSMGSSFKIYRESIAALSDTTSCIPYIGVHLSDLIFIDENADRLGKNDTLWNISKLRLVRKVMESMMRFSGAVYYLPSTEDSDGAAQRMDSLPVYGDKELYALSMQAEPRGARRGDIL